MTQSYWKHQEKQSPQNKGETKTYKKNQFNTTEGGTYYGHTNANNAKMAVQLRRIFPSPFKRAQYIGLQQGGELNGSIIVSAPSTFQIACGEAPVQDVAGVWYAENGDINIHAPKGRVRISAMSIDLIATGDGKKTGYVSVNANTEFNVEAGNVVVNSDDNISLNAEVMDTNVTGKCEFNVGSFKVIEGGDFFTKPGQGNITVEQFNKAMKKVIGSLR
tara:strand:- start:5493 stop:6146 length:654 start_codon:yes stop_codon:yes gene_type:complete